MTTLSATTHMGLVCKSISPTRTSAFYEREIYSVSGWSYCKIDTNWFGVQQHKGYGRMLGTYTRNSHAVKNRELIRVLEEAKNEGI